MKRPQYEIIPIEKLEQRLNQIFHNHNEILIAYLYCSYSQGNNTKFSDIDIGVVLEDSFQEKPLYFASLAYEVKKSFDEVINIDLRVLNNQPPRFLFQVLKNGKLIYFKDKNFKDEFEIKVITKYLDIKPMLNYFDNLFLKEVYGNEN
jgi:predicted nucleotidyltransferase